VHCLQFTSDGEKARAVYAHYVHHGCWRPYGFFRLAAYGSSFILSSSLRPQLVRLFRGNRLFPSVAARRNDSIFTKYREPPNGFLFNEKPLKPGEKRQWEDWEAIWYIGWGVTFTLFAIGAIYRPEPELLKEARAEAEQRLREFDEIDAAEGQLTEDITSLQNKEFFDAEDDD